jgi:nucleotide-binding universal stress UspA family protein
MKTILVPSDFSGPAEQAFRFATTLARQGKGEIVLLHIVELPVLRHGPVPISALEKVYLKSIKEKVDKNFNRMIAKWGEGIKIRTVLDHGAVNHTIISNIKKRKIDLVVMGTHGVTGARELFIGSNAEKIVRFSPVPVITVKEKPYNKLNSIVFATDMSPLPRKVSERLHALRNFFKAQLHIVFINTPSNFRSEVTFAPKVKAFMTENGFSKNCTFTTYNDISEVEGIINFSRKMKAGIVAMTTHSKKGLSHFFQGSVAEDVTNHIECPIWTCSIES